MSEKMIITKIEQQKKREHRYSIFINGTFSFGLDGTDVLFFKLKENDVLDDKTYNHIIDNIEFTKAKDSAVHFLSYRGRSEREIRNKLKEKEYGEIVIEKVMDLLKKYDYINDESFAKLYIRDKMKIRGYGKVRIVYELVGKGVDRKIIETAYDSLFSEDSETSENLAEAELENALGALRKKWRTKEIADRKEIKKAQDFLVRKGFTYDTISHALKLYGKECDLSEQEQWLE